MTMCGILWKSKKKLERTHTDPHTHAHTKYNKWSRHQIHTFTTRKKIVNFLNISSCDACTRLCARLSYSSFCFVLFYFISFFLLFTLNLILARVATGKQIKQNRFVSICPSRFLSFTWNRSTLNKHIYPMKKIWVLNF